MPPISWLSRPSGPMRSLSLTPSPSPTFLSALCCGLWPDLGREAPVGGVGVVGLSVFFRLVQALAKFQHRHHGPRRPDAEGQGAEPAAADRRRPPPPRPWDRSPCPPAGLSLRPPYTHPASRVPRHVCSRSFPASPVDRRPLWAPQVAVCAPRGERDQRGQPRSASLAELSPRPGSRPSRCRGRGNWRETQAPADVRGPLAGPLPGPAATVPPACTASPRLGPSCRKPTWLETGRGRAGRLPTLGNCLQRGARSPRPPRRRSEAAPSCCRTGPAGPCPRGALWLSLPPLADRTVWAPRGPGGLHVPQISRGAGDLGSEGLCPGRVHVAASTPSRRAAVGLRPPG